MSDYSGKFLIFRAHIPIHPQRNFDRTISEVTDYEFTEHEQLKHEVNKSLGV